MIIKILGMGCASCQKLYKSTQESLKETNLEGTVEKVEEIKKIMSYGVMRTPALVINEKVKVFGRVPNKEEIKKYIQEEI
ncbi:MAG: thioredoxin family protein [Clostridia bacterium]|nr:thioredoxin family protein [Clostridia bacterium]